MWEPWGHSLESSGVPGASAWHLRSVKAEAGTLQLCPQSPCPCARPRALASASGWLTWQGSEPQLWTAQRGYGHVLSGWRAVPTMCVDLPFVDTTQDLCRPFSS